MGYVGTDVEPPFEKIPMAKIIWHENVLILLDEHINYAYLEFGKSTALRWKTEIAAFEERVKLFPESYPPEELLANESVLYRRRHLMNRRFKLIHYYDEAADTVHVVDIWDVRMNPETLILRIK